MIHLLNFCDSTWMFEMAKESLICTLLVITMVSAAGSKMNDHSSILDQTHKEFFAILRKYSDSMNISQWAEKMKNTELNSFNAIMDKFVPKQKETYWEPEKRTVQLYAEEEEKEEQQIYQFSGIFWVAMSLVVILCIFISAKKLNAKYFSGPQLSSAPFAQPTLERNQISQPNSVTGNINRRDFGNLDMRINSEEVPAQQQADDSPPEYWTVICEAPPEDESTYKVTRETTAATPPPEYSTIKLFSKITSL